MGCVELIGSLVVSGLIGGMLAEYGHPIIGFFVVLVLWLFFIFIGTELGDWFVKLLHKKGIF